MVKSKKKTLYRPDIDETMKNGHFGIIAKGWPYEGMFDENQGLTSSVYGQDQYRLNEGPVDLVHRTSAIKKSPRRTGGVSKKMIKKSADDLAEQWLSKNDPSYKKHD